jgi:hypothetical protein
VLFLIHFFRFFFSFPPPCWPASPCKCNATTSQPHPYNESLDLLQKLLSLRFRGNEKYSADRKLFAVQNKATRKTSLPLAPIRIPCALTQYKSILQEILRNYNSCTTKNTKLLARRVRWGVTLKLNTDAYKNVNVKMFLILTIKKWNKNFFLNNPLRNYV